MYGRTSHSSPSPPVLSIRFTTHIGSSLNHSFILITRPFRLPLHSITSPTLNTDFDSMIFCSSSASSASSGSTIAFISSMRSNHAPEPTGTGRSVLYAGVSVFFISLVAGGSAFYVRRHLRFEPILFPDGFYCREQVAASVLHFPVGIVEHGG